APGPAEAPALVGDQCPAVRPWILDGLAAEVLGTPVRALSRVLRPDSGRECVGGLEPAWAAAAQRQAGPREGAESSVRSQVETIAQGHDRVVVRLEAGQRRVAERAPVGQGGAVGALRAPGPCPHGSVA